MNRRLTLITLAAAITITSSAVAEEPVALADVLRRAAARPAAEAAGDQAAAAEAVADAERRAALLPSVSLRAAAEQRDRSLSLTTPMATLEVADSRRLTAQVAVRQPILEPSRLFYTAPAARNDARASRQEAARARELYAAAAGSRYFDVLELDARARSVAAHVASLETRLGELDALVAEGRAIESDRLRLRLALDDARLAARNLDRDRAVAALALGHAIGADEPVEPAPLARPLSDAAEDVSRPDLRALELRREAVLERRAGVAAELIPSVSLEGAWIYDDSLFADDDSFFTVTLNLSWTPLAGGTRGARRRALAAQASALTRQRVELQRQVELESKAARSASESARETLAISERGVEDAAEAHRVSLERYRAGRETVSDLLEVEALLRERETRRAVAEIAVSRAALAARLAAGTIL